MMKLMNLSNVSRGAAVAILLIMTVAQTACITRQKIDWAARVGTYNFDQAVTEMGPPDKRATLQDGTDVCEWLTMRGYTRGTYFHTYRSFADTYTASTTPDEWLRLTFDKEHILREWRYVWK